ncbi:ribonuclease P protein component [Gaetbulibacter aquiaggeris]|uniref:Ribonuclease P protein component n=1 Tax=Gaetbulibacter aquiaggeris TaxID=1735373 RepID=A0ABW7MLT1_9FLAO
MKFTFNKKEKLKSKKLIDTLFSEGQSLSAFPLRLVYISTPFDDGVLFKTGVSVSKKHFKRAVDRNRIKRLMREAFRLNKAHYFDNISTPYAFMILYIGKEIPTLMQLENKMAQLFYKFSKVTSNMTPLENEADS